MGKHNVTGGWGTPDIVVGSLLQRVGHPNLVVFAMGAETIRIAKHNLAVVVSWSSIEILGVIHLRGFVSMQKTSAHQKQPMAEDNSGFIVEEGGLFVGFLHNPFLAGDREHRDSLVSASLEARGR